MLRFRGTASGSDFYDSTICRRTDRQTAKSCIFTSRLLAAAAVAKNLSKDNGFLVEAFGNEWEIVREPGVDPAFERASPGDSFGPPAHHTPLFVVTRT